MNRLALLALLAVPVLLAAEAPAPPATAPAPRGRQELARARVEVCRKALPLAMERYYTGVEKVDLVGGWSLRLLDSLRDAGLSKDDLAAAIREHLKALRQFESDAKARFDNGLCTQTDVLGATYFRLQAEQRLAEAEGE